MKRLISFMLIAVLSVFSGCSMESVIPETGETYSYYLDNKELFSKAVDVLSDIDYDALISKTDYYAPEGAEDFTGCYVQNMSDLSYKSFENVDVEALFISCNVKLIDVIHRGDLTVCSFDMCIPGKNYDYGIYYTSADQAIYLGDPTVPLTESGNGFVYEQNASYGTKFKYFSEKLADHYYYYEIM